MLDFYTNWIKKPQTFEGMEYDIQSSPPYGAGMHAKNERQCWQIDNVKTSLKR